MTKALFAKALVVVACSAIVACGREPDTSGAPRSQPDTKAVASDAIRFVIDEGSRRQSLELRQQAGNTFDAVIAIEGSCSRSEAGKAEAVSEEGDSEVEVDPDGEGHLTDSFNLTLRDGCTVDIRLAAPDRAYAWLRESGCAASCALSDEPMTRK